MMGGLYERGLVVIEDTQLELAGCGTLDTSHMQFIALPSLTNFPIISMVRFRNLHDGLNYRIQ
jgi:hypothetical protein